MQQLSLKIGSSHLQIPEGWALVSQSDEKLVLSSNRKQEATISLTRFVADITFDQFKTACALQLKAVQKAIPAAFVEPEQPFQDRGTFGMFYFGGEKECGRIFFGYVSLRQRELLSMFVEGLSIDPEAHALDFQSLVKSLTRSI